MTESTIQYSPRQGLRIWLLLRNAPYVLIGYLRKEGEGELLYTVLYILYYMEGLSKTKKMLVLYMSVYTLKV